MRKLFLLPALLLCLGATPASLCPIRPISRRARSMLVNLLPPPPEPNSRSNNGTSNASSKPKGQARPSACGSPEADARVDICRFADVLGPNFAPDKMPGRRRVLPQSARDTGPVVGMSPRIAGSGRGHSLPTATDPSAGPDAAGNRHRARYGGAEYRAAWPWLTLPCPPGRPRLIPIPTPAAIRPSGP